MSVVQTYTTTAEHFKEFQACCKEFLTAFGLLDWRIDFAHVLLNPDSAASCTWHNGNQHIATLSLSTEWNEAPVPYALCRSAYHEVLHVLLADAFNVACYDDLSATQTVEALHRAHHAIIRRLENTYMPTHYKEGVEKP